MRTTLTGSRGTTGRRTAFFCTRTQRTTVTTSRTITTGSAGSFWRFTSFRTGTARAFLGDRTYPCEHSPVEAEVFSQDRHDGPEPSFRAPVFGPDVRRPPAPDCAPLHRALGRFG